MNEQFLEAGITDEGRCSWIGYEDGVVEPLLATVGAVSVRLFRSLTDGHLIKAGRFGRCEGPGDYRRVSAWSNRCSRVDLPLRVLDDHDMKASGNNGQIEFTGTAVHITRHGFGGAASHLEPWSMPVAFIADVIVHEPKGLIPGFISFVTLSHVAPTGYVSAAKDEQTVLFKHKTAADVEAVRTAVLAAIGAH